MIVAPDVHSEPSGAPDGRRDLAALRIGLGAGGQGAREPIRAAPARRRRE